MHYGFYQSQSTQFMMLEQLGMMTIENELEVVSQEKNFTEDDPR